MSALNKHSSDGLRSKKILLAHSNDGSYLHDWHERRRLCAERLGFSVSIFKLTDYHPFNFFPEIDRKWRKRDFQLMQLYEALGEKISDCDVFIHYNGALIHPEFIEQFDKLKVYHCADDPDSSDVLSRPVAVHYDICAISNPACMDMYKKWGCEHVFFWPLGAFHFDDLCNTLSPLNPMEKEEIRDIPIIFLGSKYGVRSNGILGRAMGSYKKKRFFTQLEKTFPEMVAYGNGWSRGYVDDDLIPDLYRRAQLGVNVHNSLGPINARLYDLAAFGVCQICDNKSNLNFVFNEGQEIIGFDSYRECVELIRYYLTHKEEARNIGRAAAQRYLKDYTMEKIWLIFFQNLANIGAEKIK